MATSTTRVGLFFPKFVNNLRILTTATSTSRSPSISASVSPLNLTEKPAKTTTTTTTIRPSITTQPQSILDLSDHQALFASVPTKKLFHATLILTAAAFGPTVDIGNWVLTSRAINIETNKILREIVLNKIVRHTFYEHFVAGESAFKAKECVLRLYETSGLQGMLDYSVEFASDGEVCDRNLDGLLHSVDSALSLPPSYVRSVVAKITAICPLQLLERVSDLFRWQQKHPSFSLPWKHQTFPIFSDSSPLYHTLQKPEPLTLEEEAELQQCQERLWKLFHKCANANIPLIVDAEHTQVQPAIDYLTYSSAIKFRNGGGYPIVYGTIQAYLKDARDRLSLVSEAAEKMGVPMGFKLVRGAYMSTERKLADSLGYESPIHSSIQETHASYNDSASFLLNSIANGSRNAVILATHNVESGRRVAKEAHDLGIGKVNHRLEFAQLYGMAEALSLGLRNAGFQVSKYMPYGPVDVVIPYLLRRAEENRGLLSASGIDRELMGKELLRRLKDAIF